MTSIVTNTATKMQTRLAPKSYSPFSFIKNLFTKSNTSAVAPDLARRLSKGVKQASPQVAPKSFSFFSFIKSVLMNSHPSTNKPNVVGRLTKGAVKQARSVRQFVSKNRSTFSFIGNWIARCHPSAPKPNLIGRIAKELTLGYYNDSTSNVRKAAEQSTLRNKKI